MSNSLPSADQRVQQYAQIKNVVLSASLGKGVNGTVWFTNRRTAVKTFNRQSEYEREWSVYARLAELEINFINEFEVPQMLAWDDRLMVIEMSLVSPPFILDFAGAYLHAAPEFPLDALAQQEAANMELFGQKWPRVRLLLAKLRSMGIHYVDINRGNIRFPDFDDEAISEN